MDNASYATLTRQTGLRDELQVIANNLANASTTGYRREGIVFSEFVSRHEDADASLSMARANVRIIDRSQGQLQQTGGMLDFALEGEGFFLVEGREGRFLTRAGNFHLNPAGELVTADGARLLDAGEAPIQLPADASGLSLAPDGTLSIDGRAVAQVGVFNPADPMTLSRAAGVRFTAEAGVVPVAAPSMIHGFVEGSNVDPVLEVARMIEVQRAYEAGRSFGAGEHERMRDVIQTLGK